MSEHLKGLLLAFVGVLILSPDSLLIRLANIDQWALLVCRGLMMALGIGLVSWRLDRTPPVAQYLNIGKAGLVVSLFFATSTVAFVNAVTYTTIANTLLILAISPLFAMFYSYLFLGESFKLITLVAVVFVMLGLLLVVGQGARGSHWLGNACALISAASIAATFVLNRRHKNINMMPAISLSGLLVAFVTLPLANWAGLGAQSALLLLLMGAVVTLAFVLITMAPRYIPAAEVSLLFPLETVGGIGLAWIFLNEVPSQQTLVGAAVILITLMIHSGLTLSLAKIR